MAGACGWVHAGGQIQRTTEAAVMATDRGFLFGDAVYTVLKVRASVPLFIGRHLARLERYLRRLGSPPSADLSQVITNAIADVVEANRLADGRVRVTISRQASPGDMQPVGGISLVAMAYPASVAVPAVDAMTYPDGRDQLRDIKSVNRLVATVALHAAQETGADEAIFTTAGHLVEGTCHNLFAWDGDQLTTPDLEYRGVAGVVREVLMERLPVVLGDPQVGNTASLYLTNSITGVAAVRRLNGHELPLDNGMHAQLRATLRDAEEVERRTVWNAGQ